MSALAARGIWAAILTPVDARGAIDVGRWLRHAQWLLGEGCHGLGVFGTTGETQAFSVAERQAGLEALLAAGLAAERLIVGVGCCARSDTLALAAHAVDLGCHRLLALPPFFYKGVSDEGVFRAFAEIVEGLGDDRLELFLYHFPQVSAVPISPGVIERLLRAFPRAVRGLKDSSGDLAHTTGLIGRFPPLAIFAGADGHLLEVLAAGGAGTISAAANLNAAASRRVFDAFAAGDMAAAMAGMAKVAGVRKALEGHPLIPALKAVIADGRGDPEWRHVRPPLVELDAAALGALKGGLDAAGHAYDPQLYAVAGA
jgi:4-hydroxy-tetrahydrodipicolinate synthase